MQIAVVEAWLREKFSDADVESGKLFNREVVLFAPGHEGARTSKGD